MLRIKKDPLTAGWQCPRGAKRAKRKRQYQQIKRFAKARGKSTKVAKRIAAATTNKTRRQKGETKKAA